MSSRADRDRAGEPARVEAPRDGIDWRPPHGYSQQVGWDGETVVKSFFPDALDRGASERAVLCRLEGSVPLARLLPGGDAASLRMTYVPGILGEEWLTHRIDEGVTPQVRLMEQCGGTLRRLHRRGPGALAGSIPGEGTVIVHGDFAPYNMIVDANTGELRAVIDWELVRLGGPVEDLAWLEWYLRIWYSPKPGVLDALYTAYGSLPPWNDRHQAMVDRCLPHVERSERRSFPPDVAERWKVHLERTYAFEEVVGQDDCAWSAARPPPVAHRRHRHAPP